MLPAIVIVAVFFLIIVIISVSSSSPSKNNSSYSVTPNYDHSWRENNADGSFTVYDKKGAATVIKTYAGGERFIDGHRCCCADDMERWYVMKGFSEGIEGHLRKIETELECLNTQGGDDLLEEWKQRYSDYRNLCIKHGFWNWVIKDRTTFVPTKMQIRKEKLKEDQIQDLYEKWKERMAENQVIIDYLKKSPRKHAIKKKMIADLSNGDPETRKKINVIYRRLINAKVIAEKENSEGKMETRIVIHRKKNSASIKPLPASVFSSSLYDRVGKKDIYKVDYTVGEPKDLDEKNNTCYFVSKSSGEIYRTSLEKCTCPVYYKGGACKHMIALALKLGYLNRSAMLRG